MKQKYREYTNNKKYEFNYIFSSKDKKWTIEGSIETFNNIKKKEDNPDFIGSRFLFNMKYKGDLRENW